MNNDEDKPSYSSTVERLLADHVHGRLSEEDVAEKAQQYRLALNSIAASENGMFLLKTWLKAFGLFAINQSKDAAALVEERALKNFYLAFVRRHLDDDLRSKLEG
jgi:hypothetical protein